MLPLALLGSLFFACGMPKDALSHIRPGARRHRKRMLAVRAMAGEIAWLDGTLHWHQGRVAWEDTRRGLVIPTPADLALVQRRLNQIGGYHKAATQTLGDSSAWLALRRARLDLARFLHAIVAPDLAELIQHVPTHDPALIQGLVALLPAEALCQGMPAAPSAALLSCAAAARAPLSQLISNDAAPLPGRALAAMVLGNIEINQPEWRQESSQRYLAQAAPAITTAYTWGLQRGLPADPGLFVMLLAERQGTELALRCQAALQPSSRFRLPGALLRTLLAAGHPADQVVALAEAAAEAGPLARRITQPPPATVEMSRKKRASNNDATTEQRQQLVAALTTQIHAYARRSGDPATITLIVRFTQAMLALSRLLPELATQIPQVLQRGLDVLPTPLLRPYLELLVAGHHILWDRTNLAQATQISADWLQKRWVDAIYPLADLLHACNDGTVVQSCFDLGIYPKVARYYNWPDPELYRWLLTLIRAFDPVPHAPPHPALRNHYADQKQEMIWVLLRLLSRFSNARAARSAMQPLLEALIAAPTHLRINLLLNLDQELRRLNLLRREPLQRLGQYAPQIVGFAKRSRNAYICWWCLLGLLTLDRDQPAQASAWLDWLLTYLLEQESRSPDGHINAGSLSVGTLFAATLANGNFSRFQLLVQCAIRHRFEQSQELLEQSIPALARFPGLCHMLAQIFPQQPHRCAELTVRVGLARRLGSKALAPLAELSDSSNQRDLPQFLVSERSDWSELLSLDQRLAAPAAAYLHAQWLLGGSFDVPPGVRHALAQPQKLAKELAYLEQLSAKQPERSDLRTRVANLHTRLADPDQLLATAHDEALERLYQISAAQQIAAAEQQITACYRAHLSAVAGRLPTGLVLDADLLNAILLTVDIEANRRLLLRLLRAHLSGEHAWREQHPANADFLERLSTQGVSVATWLSALPRRYPFAAISGGYLQIHLECNPLRILQMGNYFDTCLSFGGINAFSTVANACELNKRVIYVADNSGRIIGRQLIAINEQGKLVGFRIYSNIDGQHYPALCTVVTRYVASFAAQCGLELASEGTVPVLFAESWYDDGIVPWNRQEAPPPSASPHA